MEIMMNLAHMTPIRKQNQLSIDDLEKHVLSQCDNLGFVKSKNLNMVGPEYLHYEDALEILKWNYIKRSFMESQVIEKQDENDLLEYLLKEVEEEDDEYPEFDDWAA